MERARQGQNEPEASAERCVPLPDVTIRCLEAYLPQRHNQLEQSGRLDEPALLVSRNGKRLSSFAIRNGVHAISRDAQAPLHSLHQFRHSYASDLEKPRFIGEC